MIVRPANAVAGRAREHDLVAEERLERHAAVAPRRADDAELELPAGDVLDDRLRVGDGERDARPPGSRAGTRRGGAAATIAAGPGRRAELERPGELALAAGRDLVEQLLLEREQPLRARGRVAARLGRLDPTARAVEQLRAEPLLERRGSGG